MILNYLKISFNLRMIVKSAIIRFLIAGLTIHYWLLDFAYRIVTPLQGFLFDSLVAADVAYNTTNFQAMKASMSNPVKKSKNRINCILCSEVI